MRALIAYICDSQRNGWSQRTLHRNVPRVKSRQASSERASFLLHELTNRLPPRTGNGRSVRAAERNLTRAADRNRLIIRKTGYIWPLHNRVVQLEGIACVVPGCIDRLIDEHGEVLCHYVPEGRSEYA